MHTPCGRLPASHRECGRPTAAASIFRVWKRDKINYARPGRLRFSTCRCEMGRVYRDVRMKKAESQHRMGLVYVLSAIVKLIGKSEIQKRVEAFGRLRSFRYCNRLGGPLVDSQPIGFFLNHGITFARELFEPLSVHHRNSPAAVGDHAKLLQLAGGVGDALAAYAQHVRDELLRHG